MKDKLLQIVSYYDIDKQLKYFQSEIFKLNEAVITKRNRDKFNPFVGLFNLSNRLSGTKDIYVEHITEEIADVMVMLKQFQYYYEIEDEQIEEIMNYKIERQLDRIEKENE